MLLVKSVEVLEVDQDQIELTILEKARYYCSPEAVKEEKSLLRELVVGQRFVNARGEEVCIGISNQARTALGIPFEVFEAKRAELSALEKQLLLTRSVNARLTNCLKTIRGMSFWERLNRVFVGFYTLNTK